VGGVRETHLSDDFRRLHPPPTLPGYMAEVKNEIGAAVASCAEFDD